MVPLVNVPSTVNSGDRVRGHEDRNNQSVADSSEAIMGDEFVKHLSSKLVHLTSTLSSFVGQLQGNVQGTEQDQPPKNDTKKF